MSYRKGQAEEENTHTKKRRWFFKRQAFTWHISNQTLFHSIDADSVWECNLKHTQANDGSRKESKQKNQK